jgi:hypothetical protein
LNLYGRLYGPYITISHTNSKVGKVNRKIYRVPRLHNARKIIPSAKVDS